MIAPNRRTFYKEKSEKSEKSDIPESSIVKWLERGRILTQPRWKQILFTGVALLFDLSFHYYFFPNEDNLDDHDLNLNASLILLRFKLTNSQ